MIRIRRLWLRAFRNYDRADLALEPGLTVFVGANGQGKSNLLEAVYVVATGRSHRTPHEGEAIRLGATAARVRAQVERSSRDEELEITLALERDRVVSQMRVNGVVTTRGGVLGRLPVVMAAPWDLELIRGGGAGRRRVLDSALAQLSPAYFFALHRYHRVVTQRNAELRTRAAGRPGERLGAGNLDPWNAQLVELGVRLTARRTVYVDNLRPQARAWFEQLGGQGAFEVTYRPAWPGQNEEAMASEARMQLARLATDEYRRGITLTGPHRDELMLTLDGQSLRAAGSQGQWRTATLALRLAERAVMAVELGGPPVLLLDDALAELDPGRQRRILAMEAEGQVLATATALPAHVNPAHIVHVEAGSLREAETASETTWLPQSGTS